MLLGANAALADDARSECGSEITGLCGSFQFWFRPAQFKRNSQNERSRFEHLRLSRQSADRTPCIRCHIKRLARSCESDKQYVILYLTLEREWFDDIVRGIKNEEYRELK